LEASSRHCMHVMSWACCAWTWPAASGRCCPATARAESAGASAEVSLLGRLEAVGSCSCWKQTQLLRHGCQLKEDGEGGLGPPAAVWSCMHAWWGAEVSCVQRGTPPCTKAAAAATAGHQVLCVYAAQGAVRFQGHL
jgi:hypothetical protein